MNITPQTLAMIVAICTFCGAIIGAGASILTTWLNKRSEDRRHLRQLVVNAAMEEWKQQIEIYKVHKQTTTLFPLDIYIIRMTKFAEIFLAKDVSTHDVANKLKEIEELTTEMLKHKKVVSRSAS